jgi:short-subunit dehydrogenase
LANTLSARGDQVVVIDKDPVAEDIHTRSIVADLSDRTSVLHLSGRLADEGPFDLVFLNAGASATGRFETIPSEIYRRLLMLNVESPILMTTQLLKPGCLAEGAVIVFVSSLSHKTGYPGGTVYAATKDAVAVFARSIRAPLRNRNIHVLTVFPGPIETAQAERHAPPGANRAARMPAERLAATILEAVRRRKPVLYPGLAAKIGLWAGTLFPYRTTRFMRRVLYERMDREVY